MEGRSGRSFPSGHFWPLAVALGAALLVLGRVVLLELESSIRSFSPGCFFQRATGLYCAGCGGTRAFFAFLKGDVPASWKMNPLFLTGLILAMFFSGIALARRFMSPLPEWIDAMRLTARTGYILLGMIVAFWILRNIPGWPADLFAPHW